MSVRHGKLPQQVYPFRLAESGRVIQGQMPLSQMKRLADIAKTTSNQVDVTLSFGVDDTGTRFMQGSMRTDVCLICQRCLESMPYTVNAEILLGFVRSGDEADCLMGEYDPWIVKGVAVRLADMIEDELILCLPQVPMHPVEDCPSGTLIQTEGSVVEDRKNPFAMLESLKRRNQE